MPKKKKKRLPEEKKKHLKIQKVNNKIWIFDTWNYFIFKKKYC